MRIKLLAATLICISFVFAHAVQAKYIDSKGRVWSSRTEYLNFLHPPKKKTKPKKAPAKKVIPKKIVKK